MSSKRWADSTIPEPTKGPRLLRKNYTLKQIAKACHDAFKSDHWMLRDFAQGFTPDMNGLRDLFNFVDKHFRYNEDKAYSPDGDELSVQAVQSPAYMWHITQTGDCKSFTVFLACALYNMGVPVILRLVNYGSKYEYHIYPVALLDGQEVPLDVVYKKQQNGPFGSEKLPMRKIEDILEKPGLYKVGAMGQAPTVEDLSAYANRLNFIADTIGMGDGPDVTEMTGGEFDAWLLGKSMAASGYGMSDLTSGERAQVRQHLASKTAPAFPPVMVAIRQPEAVNGIFDKVKDKVKDVVDDVKDAIGNALKSFINVFHKEENKKVADYFLYEYLTPAQLAKASPEVKRRKAAQDKILASWEKNGKIGSRQQLLDSMAVAFKAKYGVTPQQVASGAVGMAKIIKGIGTSDAADAFNPPATDTGGGGSAPPVPSGGLPGSKDGGLVGTTIAALAKNQDAIAKAVKNVFSILGAIFGKKDDAEKDATTENGSDPFLLPDGSGGGGTDDGGTGGGGSGDGSNGEGGSSMLVPVGIGLGLLLLLMGGKKKG